MAAAPGLAVRLGWTLLRFESRKRHGVRTFERALIRGGMPANLAARLSDDYASYGRLRDVIASGVRLSSSFDG